MASQGDDVRTRVAEYVRYWRSYAGLSIADVLEPSGVSRSKWSDVENARGDQPRPETLGAMAKAIGRDPGELLAIIGVGRPDAAVSPERHRQVDEALTLVEATLRAHDRRLAALEEAAKRRARPATR